MVVLITSIVAFASTNIDDLFLLILFFGNQQYRTSQVVLGQYLGFAALVALSLLGSLAELVIQPKYIGILGLLPIYLGIKGLIHLYNNKSPEPSEAKEQKKRGASQSVLSFALITFANGGDNIAIYVPLFAALAWWEKAAMIFVFFFMVAVWCGAASYLSKHPLTARTIHRYGHLAAPLILLLLGVYILIKSDTVSLFL